MLVKIKNTKIFKVDRDCKYHWSKLSKLIRFMRDNCLIFQGQDLCGADLRGADLRGANLCGADLCGADLRGANLRGANLRGANFYRADLCGANLCGADLCGAIISDPENANKITIKDFMLVQGLGSQNRTTYFFDTEEKELVVRCGCFYGTEEKFREKIKETHNDGQFAKEYLAMLEVVKIRFSRG